MVVLAGVGLVVRGVCVVVLRDMSVITAGGFVLITIGKSVVVLVDGELVINSYVVFVAGRTVVIATLEIFVVLING